jgi:hypothetical protein
MGFRFGLVGFSLAFDGLQEFHYLFHCALIHSNPNDSNDPIQLVDQSN